MIIKVQTYSGYKADEYPVRFFIDAICFDIIDLEDRWYDPTGSYFKVLASDAKTYILKKDVRNDCWRVIQRQS